jgi:hypothetical protein
MRAPSRSNQAAFERAVDEITQSVTRLFAALEANGPPRTREAEKLKAQERGRQREAQMVARVLRNLSPPRPRKLKGAPG